MPLISWNTLTRELNDVERRNTIRTILRDVPSPWRTIDDVLAPVQVSVMNVLQQELDETSARGQYYTVCMKCLRELGRARNIFPDTFECHTIIKQGDRSIDGGGFSDIWIGDMDGAVVCLKVLRTWGMKQSAADKLRKNLCREALVWRQLRHENILAFLGVNLSYFKPSCCLISPWMKNGNIIRYLEENPKHNRLKSIREISSAVEFLHGLDPLIIHGDIRGTNILVTDDLRCCLADFGASLIIATQAPSTYSMNHNTAPWRAPELYHYNSESYNQQLVAGGDIYAFGCTMIEIFTLERPFYPIDPNLLYKHIVVDGKRHKRPSKDVFPSDELWKLVENCMDTEPAKRPSASDIKSRVAHIPAGDLVV